MKRCLWLTRGWPNRMAAVLAGGEVKVATQEAFRRDLEAFEALVAAPDASSAMMAVIRRSVFQRTSVKQLVQAVKVFDARGRSF